jgi:hypothetical protein
MLSFKKKIILFSFYKMETKNLIIYAVVLYILYQFFIKKEGYGDIENIALENAINARNEANRVYEDALTNKIKADYLAEMKKNEIDKEVNQIKVEENNKMLEAEMKAKEAEMKASFPPLVNPDFNPLPVSMMRQPIGVSPFGPQPFGVSSPPLVNPEFNPLPVSMMPQPFAVSPFGPQPNINRQFSSPTEDLKRLEVQQKVDMLAKKGLPYEEIMKNLTEEEMITWKNMA